MKKILFSVLLVGFASAAYAVEPQFRVPVSVNNVADPGLKSAGVDIAYLVTSTTPALVTDSVGTTINDGFIHWLILGSTVVLPTNGIFLELRSTNTANITSTRLMPRIMATENSLGTSGTDQYLEFSPPIPFSNGLSVNIGPAATNPLGNEPCEFSVGVRWKRQ